MFLVHFQRNKSLSVYRSFSIHKSTDVIALIASSAFGESIELQVTIDYFSSSDESSVNLIYDGSG